MQTMTLKAVVAPTTDLGEFTAVISTEHPDREGDVVRADALVAALKAWNRPIPLTWHHSTKAEDVFGSIDPQSASADNAEVTVAGRVDLDSARGKTAWPLMKAGVLGFSYGYLIPEGGSKDIDGGREISAIDVFEVTGTITPMNNGTRVTDTKSLNELEALRERLTDLEASVKALQEQDASSETEVAPVVAETAPAVSHQKSARVIPPEELAIRQEIRDAMTVALRG